MSSLLDPSFRPTFFELFAAERLTPGLKGALLYALGVAAQRRPSLIRVLDWGDEVYALFSAVLEGSTLASSSATFAESLYAPRRAWPAREGGSRPSSGWCACSGWCWCPTYGIRPRRRTPSGRKRRRCALLCFASALVRFEPVFWLVLPASSSPPCLLSFAAD